MTARILLILLALFTTTWAAENVPSDVIEDYLAAAEPAADKSDWKISLAFGATYTDGNSDTLTVAFNGTATTEWDKFKLALGLQNTYGKSSGVVTANEHVGTERLDYTLDEISSIFQTLLVENDDIEAVSIRLIFGAGYARRLIKNDTFEMWGELGAAVIYEDYYVTGENTEPVAVITIRWKWDITEQLVYEQVISILPSLEDGGEGRIYAEAKFSTPLGGNWKLQLIIRDVYNTQPALGNVKNDITVILALTVTF